MLIVKEALEMLDKVPDSDKPAAVNKALTITQARDIVRKGIAVDSDDAACSDLSEKRVWQVVKNQKRPRY